MKTKQKSIRRFQAMVMAFLLVLTSILPIFAEVTPVKADNGIVLRLHYNRPDGNYDGWSAWLWEIGGNGSDKAFVNENGDMVATLQVSPKTTTIGFIVKTPEWTKDIDKDQFIDISEVISGTVDAYVESGVEGCTIKYGADCVKGIRVKSASLSSDFTTVEIATTGEVENNGTGAFKVENNQGEAKIASVESKENFVYLIKMAEPLDSSKKYQLTFNGVSYQIVMPNIYSTKMFEDKYTYTGDDLGATYTKDATSFRLWAPTAESVVLNTYATGNPEDENVLKTYQMTADVNGTWVATVSGDLNGTYYTYTATIDGEQKTSNDPYGRTTGVNGKRSMVIDLASTNPEGWENDKNPNAGKNITDAIIYETHVRDLTVGETNGIKNQGKYLGMIETGTKSTKGIPTGLNHIKDLGATHLQILPMYDFGSVDETGAGNRYNWGYDPVNYNVPEGSYSSDASKGEVRVAETKKMIQGLHENGISVVMDVVYNHVQNASEFNFNVLVPGYFSRINADGSYSSGSGCGNDTASERAMVKKYIVDSVNYWADEYHIDGFRFDLVGLIDIDTINEIVKTVQEKHPDVIFYGEGWTMATDVTKENVTLATQVNSEKTPNFAYFNDAIRDGLKGSVFDEGTGFVSGSTDRDQIIKDGFLGASEWSKNKNPAQTVNYASCHDNNTLYDRLQISRKDASKEELIRMNNLTAAIYLTAQGIPFFQAGEEMLRTKVNEDGTFNHNSYSAGDKVNEIDWNSLADASYKQVYDYYKGLIAFRKAHSALRLMDAKDVAKYVTSIEGLNDQVLGFNIKGGMAGETAEEMMILFNATTAEQKVALPEGNWNVYVDDTKAGTTALASVRDTAWVAPVSALILVKEDVVAGVTENTETKADGTVVNTKVETKADGSKVSIAVETAKDGSKVSTVVRTATNGTSEKVVTSKNADGIVARTVEQKAADRTTQIAVATKGKNKAGNSVVKVVKTQKDANGAEVSVKETSKILASADTSILVNVEKAGEVSKATASVSVVKDDFASNDKVSISKAVVDQIVEQAGADVAITTVIKSQGKVCAKLTVKAADLTDDVELKLYRVNKAGKKVRIGEDTYKVDKTGTISIQAQKNCTYELVK